MSMRTKLTSNSYHSKCIWFELHESFINALTGNYEITCRVLSLLGCQTTSYTALTNVKKSNCGFLDRFLSRQLKRFSLSGCYIRKKKIARRLSTQPSTELFSVRLSDLYLFCALCICWVKESQNQYHHTGSMNLTSVSNLGYE